MYKRKKYVITAYDPEREKIDAPAAKGSYYQYNLTCTVQGYSKAVRTAKRVARRYGVAMLWDERGVIEPENGYYDHHYINVYQG